MAKIRRTKRTEGKKAKTASALRKPPGKSALKRTTGAVDVDLPTQKSEVADDIRLFSLLIHGEKKIGKTSLFAQEEGALFLEWDPEQKALSIFQRQVPDWRHFLGYVKLIEEQVNAGTFDFRTVVVDGVDQMYSACFAYTCKRLGIVHPHDEDDFGKSWRAIKTEFKEGFLRLMKLPGIATRFICHSAWREVKSRNGVKIDKLVPTLTGQAEEALVGEVDLWGAYLYDGAERVLVIKGDEMTGAGHRIDQWFCTPDGEMVQEIPMGASAGEAYVNLNAAFNNEQTFVSLETRPRATKARAPKKGGAKTTDRRRKVKTK